MWNETDIPLAYLITFRTYGSWLHGDARGSTDRFHNQYQTPHIAPDKRWQQHNTKTLKADAVTLDAAQRTAVEKAVRETCEKRGWLLHASNVRTNHAHSVVSSGETKSKVVLAALKANATREMRQSGCWQSQQTPWAEQGSRRSLWNERSIERAIDYVINGQGDELPDFD